MPRIGELLTIREVAKIAERSRLDAPVPEGTPWVCASSLRPGAKRGCQCGICHNGYQRMLRQLLVSNAQCGGMLLVNVTRKHKHPTWRLTLEALAQLNPQWFVRSQKVEDRQVEIERLLADHAELLEVAHRHIGELRRRIDALEKRKAA